MPNPKHIIEYVFTRSLYGLITCMPLSMASAVGAGLGAVFAVVPSKVNNTSRANIRKAFPKLSEQDIRKIQFASTQHIARTFFEMPHVYRMSKKTFNKRVTLHNAELINDNSGALILTAHLGDWDMVLKTFSIMGHRMASIYRKANNPMVDAFIFNTRQLDDCVQIPKGVKGARKLVSCIREGLYVGFLNDQKMNDGLDSTFFGHHVKTASAIVDFAHKHNKPVLPVYCYRRVKHGFFVSYDVHVLPPLKLGKTAEDSINIANKSIEDAITKHPEQWMWMHKRFGKG